MNYTLKLTLKGLLECLATDEINSKGIIKKAFKGASSYDLIGFRNDINKEIAKKIVKERNDEVSIHDNLKVIVDEYHCFKVGDILEVKAINKSSDSFKIGGVYGSWYNLENVVGYQGYDGYPKYFEKVKEEAIENEN